MRTPLTGRDFAERLKKQRPDILAEARKDQREWSIVRAIIKERVRRGLTQAQLAEMAGVRQYQVSKIEREQIGNWSTLRKVMQALDITLVALAPGERYAILKSPVLSTTPKRLRRLKRPQASDSPAASPTGRS